MRHRLSGLLVLALGLVFILVPGRMQATVVQPFQCWNCSEYDAGAYHPSWSPDGAPIAIAASNWYPPGSLWEAVFAVPLAGGQEHHYCGSHGFNNQPDWSPDGSLLVFTGGGYGLITCDGSGSGYGHLILNGAADHPAWSPDGARIAFDRLGNIWTVPATGGTPVQITTTGGRCASWSPDGTRLVYESSGSLWIIPSSGGSPTFLTVGQDPDWSPNGTTIAFARDDIWMIRATGGHEVQVTQDPRLEKEPTWAPDNQKIAFTRVDGSCSCVLIASELPDFPVSVMPTSWSLLKRLYN
jgi:Tol biopolymer transport system component